MKKKNTRILIRKRRKSFLAKGKISSVIPLTVEHVYEDSFPIGITGMARITSTVGRLGSLNEKIGRRYFALFRDDWDATSRTVIINLLQVINSIEVTSPELLCK